MPAAVGSLAAAGISRGGTQLWRQQSRNQSVTGPRPPPWRAARTIRRAHTVAADMRGSAIALSACRACTRTGQSGDHLYSWGMSQGGLALLLRLNKSWHGGISAEDLYEITRAWWVMSPANAQRVERVLAVAGGVVREAYEPRQWLPSPVEGLENRIGFEGVVAPDRETYVGRDVSHLFRYGSANPVRYLPLDALSEEGVITPDPVPKAPSAAAEKLPGGAAEPGLLERVLPLLNAFEKDLLWAQSRAGQELFHSNTIAWLLRNFPIPCAPLLDLGEGAGVFVADGGVEQSAIAQAHLCRDVPEQRHQGLQRAAGVETGREHCYSRAEYLCPGWRPGGYSPRL